MELNVVARLVFGALLWILLTAYSRGRRYGDGSWYARCFRLRLRLRLHRAVALKMRGGRYSDGSCWRRMAVSALFFLEFSVLFLTGSMKFT